MGKVIEARRALREAEAAEMKEEMGKVPEYFWWEDDYFYPEIIVKEGRLQCTLCQQIWDNSDLLPGQQDCPSCGGSLHSANFTEQILRDEGP